MARLKSYYGIAVIVKLTYPETKVILRHEVVNLWNITFASTDSHIQRV